MKRVEDIKVLFSEEMLKSRLKELADEINAEFSGEELTIVCVLKGSSLFFCDLAKHLTIPVKMEFIRVSSYGNAQTSSGHVQALDLTLPNLENKNALIVEDIVDTGNTLKFLLDLVSRTHRPKKLKVVTLLNKKIARTVDVEPDYYGFEVDNKFVVGYGLDDEGYFRNLPYVGYFE